MVFTMSSFQQKHSFIRKAVLPYEPNILITSKHEKEMLFLNHSDYSDSGCIFCKQF